MDIEELMYQKARERQMTVVFPECTEEKILKTARICADEKICVPLLVGNAAEAADAAEEFEISLDGIEIADVSDSDWLSKVVEEYLAINPIFAAPALQMIAQNDSIYAAMILQALGKADVSLAGLVHATADVILVGKMIIGMADGIQTASSVGLFHVPGFEGPEGPYMGFGDSAICANPTAEELAEIAISACETFQTLLDWDVRCALLSYSTLGSTAGELVDKVVEAVRIAQEKRPDLKIDGEFQLDSAINPEVASRKVKRESEVAGRANVIIWPDLNAGNIGVKLIQEFAHGDAIGPFLQGFKKIVCDCSRGASITELVGNVAFSCVRAAGLKGE